MTYDTLTPGKRIPGMPGYVAGTCGHRLASSEWRAGFRTCERCPAEQQATPLPWRVVTSDWRAFRGHPPTGDHPDPLVYTSETGLTTTLAYEQLAGPRPVVEPEFGAEAAVYALVTYARHAGHALTASLARALATVHERWERELPASVYSLSPRTGLVLGDPTTWQSAALEQLTHTGAHIPIASPLVDPILYREAVHVLREWIGHPSQYTEVAENLAAALGPVVQAAGGWPGIAHPEMVADLWHDPVGRWLCSETTTYGEQARLVARAGDRTHMGEPCTH